MPAQCLDLQLVPQIGTSFSMPATAGTFWWQRNCFPYLNIIHAVSTIQFNSIRHFLAQIPGFAAFFVPRVSVLLSSAIPFLPFHSPPRPSSGSSFQRPSPSSSTFPFFDGSINFSRSVCGTHWLHWATLLLKHKLISCSHPPSINHRPSTCSPLHPCLLLFPTQISLLLPLPPTSHPPPLTADTHPHPRADMWARARRHTFGSGLRCVMAQCAGMLRVRGRGSWDWGQETVRAGGVCGAEQGGFKKGCTQENWGAIFMPH